MYKGIIKTACYFFLLLSNYSVCQSYLQDQFDLADSLYKNEKYFDCITELKRLKYFDSTKAFSYSSNMMIGDCYKKGAKYNEAVNYYTMADIVASNSSDVYKAKISIVRTNILRDQPGMALMQLERMDRDPAFTPHLKDITYWKGWTFMRMGEWQKANIVFINYKLDTALINITAMAKDKKYFPVKAKLLSVFIPGAGQFYTGNYVSGVLSLAWNVLCGYYTINAFNSSRVFDGLVIGNLLWLRFYSGNISNAEEYAIEKNNLLYNIVFTYLEQEYTGLKP